MAFTAHFHFSGLNVLSWGATVADEDWCHNTVV